MYDLRAIANFFINRGMRDSVDISQMKLQKLLYFAYGLFLVRNGGIKNPLFNERFEAWPYGPVIPELYHMVKGYGSQPIGRCLGDVMLDIESNSWKLYIPVIDKSEKDAFTYLEEFWRVYRDYTAIELSNATHLDGTPWKITLDRREKVISDKEMYDYFKNWVN